MSIEVILHSLEHEDLKVTFKEGEHVIGRGELLKCDSKLVSRNHAVLQVFNNGDINLKSTHQNPCFIKSGDTGHLSIVKNGEEIILQHGDKLALLPTTFWFRIEIIKNPASECDMSNNNNICASLKRNIDEENDDTHSIKKSKTEETVNEEASTSNNSELTTKNTNEIEPECTENNTISIKQENDDTADENIVDNLEADRIQVKQEINEEENKNDEENASEEVMKAEKEIEEENKSNEENTSEKKIKKENEIKDEPEEEKPSTSGSANISRRDRCWYGVNCYRKNPLHRTEYCHPGDTDYDSDPNDSRPICQFGAQCYRKNKDHRREYRHPGNNPKKRKATKKAPKKVQDTSLDEEDDYDYSDPFLNDGSSDDYAPSDCSDEDSDYSDDKEETEGTKRMLREAKKFTRGK